MDIFKLENWYLKNHRKLPFRESKDPYQIWVSEIMLQQTQVETVLPFFERFIAKYPNVMSLAEANPETLQKDVEGLGYYRRFRNMHLAAQKITEFYDGKFPETYEEIIQLPGIGKYTAGAILSIAFNKPQSALDGNVIRVLSRYLGNTSDMRADKNKNELDKINQSYIEKATPSVYTQAMMELGALVCRPKNPKCSTCPLNEHCYAYAHELTEEIPYLRPLKEKKEIHLITLKISTKQGMILSKRTSNLLKGMYEYPQFESESIYAVLSDLERDGVNLELLDPNPKLVKHVFTHQIWMMEVYETRRISGIYPEWIEVTKEELEELPMAIAHRKI